jgi:hypothetical protein
MPLGRLVRVPRKPSAAPDEQCACALNLDALLLPVEGADGKPRALDWPIPACTTHELLNVIPRTLHDTPWRPLFATDVDGFSLAQLQRKTERAKGPCLLVAVAVHGDDANAHHLGGSDTESRRTLKAKECVIGAYLSEPPAATHGAHTFFGTDETFVFAFPPGHDQAATGGFRCGIRTHRWKEGNANKEFILSSHHCIGVGGGKDGAALYLGADLQHGNTSLHCETFDCGPLVTGSAHGLRHADFRVHRLWLFDLSSHDFRAMSAIPASQLTAHGGGGDSSAEKDAEGPDGAASPGIPVPMVAAAAYATQGCLCPSSGHHRCRFIAEAQHLHGADARLYNHTH